MGRSPLGSIVKPFRLAENLLSVVFYVCFLSLTHIIQVEQYLIIGIFGSALLWHCQLFQNELGSPPFTF